MIVAVSDFNMGAMENKGLNVFNDKYVLATPETATDSDYMGIEAVIAHEYFHNWTGNRITCRDWFQLCLKEGLTVFRDQEFRADQSSRAVERIRNVRGLRAQQFVEDAGPLAHPVRPSVYREINNFYTATVYEKGAEVVRMLQTLLGAEDFRKGMDLYFARHDGEAATVEQFVQCFADASGVDLAQFMLWYSQAGTPEVVVTGTPRCAHQDLPARDRADGAADAGPAHEGADADPAVRSAWSGRDGRDLPLKLAGGKAVERGILALRKSPKSLFSRTSPSRRCCRSTAISRRRCALVANLSGDDLRFLAAHDCDPFNRWQAVQSLATRLLVDNVAAIRSGARRARATIPACSMHSPRSSTDRALEPAFVSLALDPAERGRHRPRDRPRRRSRRDLHGARSRCAGAVGSISADALARSATERSQPTRALPAGRRRRRTPRATQHLPRSAGRERGTRARSRSPRSNIATPTT